MAHPGIHSAARLDECSRARGIQPRGSALKRWSVVASALSVASCVVRDEPRAEDGPNDAPVRVLVRDGDAKGFGRRGRLGRSSARSSSRISHAGQNHRPLGTCESLGLRQYRWWPASHPSQRTILFSSSPRSQVTHRMVRISSSSAPSRSLISSSSGAFVDPAAATPLRRVERVVSSRVPVLLRLARLPDAGAAGDPRASSSPPPPPLPFFAGAHRGTTTTPWARAGAWAGGSRRASPSGSRRTARGSARRRRARTARTWYRCRRLDRRRRSRRRPASARDPRDPSARRGPKPRDLRPTCRVIGVSLDVSTRFEDAVRKFGHFERVFETVCDRC